MLGYIHWIFWAFGPDQGGVMAGWGWALTVGQAAGVMSNRQRTQCERAGAVGAQRDILLYGGENADHLRPEFVGKDEWFIAAEFQADDAGQVLAIQPLVDRNEERMVIDWAWACDELGRERAGMAGDTTPSCGRKEGVVSEAGDPRHQCILTSTLQSTEDLP